MSEEYLRSPQGSLRSPQGSLRSPQQSLRSPQQSLRSPQQSLRSPQGSMRSQHTIDSRRSDVSADRYSLDASREHGYPTVGSGSGGSMLSDRLRSSDSLRGPPLRPRPSFNFSEHSEGAFSDVYIIPEEEEEEPALPNIDHDMKTAKAYLRMPSEEEGVSLYDHLSELVDKVLCERPKNVVDCFEEYSRKLKQERFRQKTDHLQDVYDPPLQYDASQKLIPLFEAITLKRDDDDQVVFGEDEEEPRDDKVPDMLQSMFLFEQCGVGLPRHEMYAIALAVRKLAKTQPVENIRFWGKIIGTERNYLVAEATLTEEEYTRREEDLQAAEAAKKAAEEAKNAPPPPDETVEVVMEPTEEASEPPPPEPQPEPQPEPEPELQAEDQPDPAAEPTGDQAEQEVPPKPPKPFPVYPLPQNTYKPPEDVPREGSGTGLNKKVFFVCNQPTDDWVILPDATPKEVAVARQIKKYLTGNLENEIHSFPAFPGKEINYLRVQIGRISAATQISPLGFYHFGGGEDEEEEEPEEEQVLTECKVNPNYEVVKLVDLLDKSMSYWVHHTQHILKQGRTAWWSAKARGGGMGEEEEEMEGEEAGGVEEKEVGPPLLTPCSEDANLERIPAWSTRMSSTLIPDFAVGFVRSNLWPGAYAIAKGRIYDNMYVGYGLKNLTRYTPPPVEAVQEEYPTGPEIMETVDPTPEEEEAWRIAHEPKPKPELKGEEEAAPEEEEEEEDEDDD